MANADGPGLSNNNAYTDSTQPELERSRGANDRTHIFSGSLILALPKLAGQVDRSRGTSSATGSSPPSSRPATGYPLTVATGGVPGLAGNGNTPSGTGNGGNLTRPNRVEGVDCHADGSSKIQWLNPAAWTLNGYVIGTNGNVRAQHLQRARARSRPMRRSTRTSGWAQRVKLQFRVEMYNIFNTVNFLGNSLTQGGQISTYDAQNVVFNAGLGRRIVSASRAGNFGQLTAARDPRTMQLGIRLAF